MPKPSRASERISLQQKVVTFLLVDLVLLVFSGALFHLVQFGLGLSPAEINDDQASGVVLAAALYLMFGRLFRAYQSRKILDGPYTLPRLLMVLAATFSAMVFVAVLTKTAQNYSRGWFFCWVGSAFILLPLARCILLKLAYDQLASGSFVFRALSVGVFAPPLPAETIETASRQMVKVADTLRLHDINELDALAATIAQDEIDRIYLVTPWGDAPAMLPKISLLRKLSTELFLIPVDHRIDASAMSIGVFGDRLSLRAIDRPINGWDLWLKRIQDVVVASATLALFAPVMLLIALAIKLESPGPVLFRQNRVGFNGRQFQLLKFRSMRQEATDHHAARQTSRNDDRVTWVGGIIRRTSLDELPQFLNVLRGDMSVVGPRPHALLTKTNGMALWDISEQYAARHRVKPGLTGWAQVHGFRGELDSVEKVQKRVEYDIHYIENWSTWLDVKIILRTALLLVYDPSAY
jgi:Undecaprenyl-phosphate glucose phosphotransferase